MLQVYLSVGDGTNIVPRPMIYMPGFCRHKSRAQMGEMFQFAAQQYFNHKQFNIGHGGNPLLQGSLAANNEIVPALQSGTVIIVPK